MGRKNYEISEAGFKRFLQEGRGQGSGADYQPWLKVFDVPSSGFSHRVWGIKTGRIHHYMSYLEYRFHILAESWPDVIDIREQFPLNRGLTLDIARSMGVRHPCNPRRRNPIFMTTDLVLTVRKHGQVTILPRAVKPAAALGKPRTQEKLEIERRTWLAMGYEDWRTITEEDIPDVLLKNLQSLRFAYSLAGHPVLTLAAAHDLQRHMLGRIDAGTDLDYEHFCRSFDDDHGLERGESHRLLSNLLLSRTVVTDMMQPLSRYRPMTDFKVSSQLFGETV